MRHKPRKIWSRGELDSAECGKGAGNPLQEKAYLVYNMSQRGRTLRFLIHFVQLVQAIGLPVGVLGTSNGTYTPFHFVDVNGGHASCIW